LHDYAIDTKLVSSDAHMHTDTHLVFLLGTL